MRELQDELAILLNTYSKEKESNTPDFILARYLLGCLSAFNEAMIAREAWYDRSVFSSNEDALRSMSEVSVNP